MEDIDKAAVPRMRMSEIGTVGLKQYAGHITEEARRELRFPQACKTFQIMSQDETIYSALSLFEMMVSRVEWKVDLGIEPDAAKKARGKFLEEVMHDMEHSWRQFIQEVTSSFTYGFSVHEKVYRVRTRANGSDYDDGKVGIRCLPVRSQDTIDRWIFSDDGRELVGVQQSLAQVFDGGERYKTLMNGDGIIEIPRKKFLLFRVDAKRDNPEGHSPLKAAYHAWKYRTIIEEQEAIGVTRDMNGMPTLYLPPRYLSEDASPNEKAIRAYYERVIRNIQMNEQSGLILPQQYDPESRQPLFKFELMSTQGGKMYDTDAIIKRWDNKILMALFADMLKMGQDQVGSYSLAGAKTNIMAMAIEARLQEIQDVLNNDLIPQLFALNKDFTPRKDLPKLQYGDLDEVDLDEFSKAVQRIGSVGGLERDREVMNKMREALKINPRPDDAPVKEDEIMGGQSQAGGAGVGNGASKTASGRDNAAANNA